MQIMENNSTVKVTLNETMEHLKLLTSYLGGQREESAADFDKVSVLDSDVALVALLMEDAAVRLSAFFPGNLIRWRYYRSALEFTAERLTDEEGLQRVLAKAVAQETLRRWLRIAGSDYADALSVDMEELAAAIACHTAPKTGAKASPRRLPPI